MRKPTCLAYFLIVLLLGLVLSPILVFAQQDFNANYLISDEELQNWQSLGRSEILSFLRDKDGYIAELKPRIKMVSVSEYRILFITPAKNTKSIQNIF